MPSLQLKILGRNFPTFLFLGASGYIAGVGLSFFLAWQVDLNFFVVLALSVVAAVTFLSLTWISKLMKGVEDIVYYQHEVAIMLACAGFLYTIDQPILLYLDIVLLGISTLDCIGRWGCFSVGCCHGKPCNCTWGVAYSEDHVKAGFTEYYMGVKLFPIPLVEFSAVFIIICGGLWLVLNDYAPGAVLVWHTATYGTFRFVVEYFRGDPERPYWYGFSEAQWTSIVIMILVVILEFMEVLPYYSYHIWSFIGVILLMLVMIIVRFRVSYPDLMKPMHLQEIFNGLKKLNSFHGEEVSVFTTKQGIQIGSGKISDEQVQDHISLSGTRYPLTLKIAEKLSTFLLLLFPQHKSHELLEGENGVYHLLIKNA